MTDRNSSIYMPTSSRKQEISMTGRNSSIPRPSSSRKQEISMTGRNYSISISRPSSSQKQKIVKISKNQFNRESRIGTIVKNRPKFQLVYKIAWFYLNLFIHSTIDYFKLLELNEFETFYVFKFMHNQRVGKSSSLRLTFVWTLFPPFCPLVVLWTLGSSYLGLWTGLLAPKPRISELNPRSNLVLFCWGTFSLTASSCLFLSSLVWIKVNFSFLSHSALTSPLTWAFFWTVVLIATPLLW